MIFSTTLSDGSVDWLEKSIFADNSAIYLRHRNSKVLDNKIKLSINLIQTRCNKNKFIYKTTGIPFSKRKLLSKISLRIDEEQIKMENKIEFLGVIFDSKLC